MSGRFLATKVGITERTLRNIDSYCGVARPVSSTPDVLSFGLATGCSSEFMTGIRGATPPPAG